MKKRNSYFLKNVNLIDVDGGRVLPNACLRVKGGIIESFGSGLSAEKGEKTLDLKGGYLCPGLIDAHCHLFGNGVPKKAIASKGKSQERLVKIIPTFFGKVYLHHAAKSSCKQALRSGITTIRCLGDIRYSDIWAKNQINEGKFLGPTLLASGYALTSPTGHGVGTISVGCSNEAEYLAQIEKNIEQGCDWIKIMATSGVMDSLSADSPCDSRMSYEEIAFVTKKAHERGLKVSSHTENSEAVWFCLQAGVDTIEHGAPLNNAMISRLVNSSSRIVATFSPAYPTVALPAKDSKYDPSQIKATKIVYSGIASSAKTCYEQGIPLGLGTDASCPFALHSTMWRELLFFKKAVGCSNLEALRAGTLGNAEVLGMQNRKGSIGVGKDADLVVYTSNPIEDLKALNDVKMVFAKGRISKKKRKYFRKTESLLDSLL